VSLTKFTNLTIHRRCLAGQDTARSNAKNNKTLFFTNPSLSPLNLTTIMAPQTSSILRNGINAQMRSVMQTKSILKRPTSLALSPRSQPFQVASFSVLVSPGAQGLKSPHVHSLIAFTTHCHHYDLLTWELRPRVHLSFTQPTGPPRVGRSGLFAFS